MTCCCVILEKCCYGCVYAVAHSHLLSTLDGAYRPGTVTFGELVGHVDYVHATQDTMGIMPVLYPVIVTTMNTFN